MSGFFSEHSVLPMLLMRTYSVMSIDSLIVVVFRMVREAVFEVACNKRAE